MAYFIVDHATDPNKTDGIVESYQVISFQNEDGSITPTRMNFVHWPKLPIPFVHEEWSANLKFTNIYTPEDDNERDEDDELNEEIASLLEEHYPEIYVQLAEAATGSDDEEEEEDENELEAQG